MTVDQVIIAIGGTLSVWLANSRHYNARRWACVVGLIAQPAWAYATWHAQQWGMLAMCGVYTLGWARGVWNFWIRPA